MQDHYSTVASDEQREGIARVINLFGEAPNAGGAPGGAPPDRNGAPRKKAG